MSSKLALEIGAHVGHAYRALVAQIADGQSVKVPAAVEILTMAQRTPSQLDADVVRLQTRREDSASLQRIAELDEQVTQAAESYRTATIAEADAKRELDLATGPGQPKGDLEQVKKVNQLRHALADRTAEAKDAFAKATSLRDRRDRQRDELTERLQATADKSGNWDDPESFALVQIP